MIYANIATPLDVPTIQALIKDSANRRKEMSDLYERYKGGKDGVPILTREYSIGGEVQKDKINNKLSNDFFSEIVDTKTGFFCGVPIDYGYQDENQTVLDAIEYFNDINSMSDVDAETAKIASTCGLCGRLIYVDPDGELRVMVINPWELVFIGEHGVDEPRATIRYYPEYYFDDDGKKQTRMHVEVYDDVSVRYFVEVKTDDGKMVLQQEKPDYIHPFAANPLIGFANNEELRGDAENVLTLIDAYDRTLSDINNELEQFRLAYMLFVGVDIAPEDLQKVKKTGAFAIPTSDGDVKFITKELDDTVLEHHLERTENNIYRFSKSLNMKDIQFGANLTGVAMAYKIWPFEFKCKVMEQKFKNSLREQYNILSSIWTAQGIDINYLDVEFTFTRNYPHNLAEEAQIAAALKGIVSDATILRTLSIVEDPTEELKAVEEENKKAIEQMQESALNMQKNDTESGNQDKQSNLPQ